MWVLCLIQPLRYLVSIAALTIVIEFPLVRSCVEFPSPYMRWAAPRPEPLHAHWHCVSEHMMAITAVAAAYPSDRSLIAYDNPRFTIHDPHYSSITSDQNCTRLNWNQVKAKRARCYKFLTLVYWRWLLYSGYGRKAYEPSINAI